MSQMNTTTENQSQNQLLLDVLSLSSSSFSNSSCWNKEMNVSFILSSGAYSPVTKNVDIEMTTTTTTTAAKEYDSKLISLLRDNPPFTSIENESKLYYDGDSNSSTVLPFTCIRFESIISKDISIFTDLHSFIYPTTSKPPIEETMNLSILIKDLLLFFGYEKIASLLRAHFFDRIDTVLDTLLFDSHHHSPSPKDDDFEMKNQQEQQQPQMDEEKIEEFKHIFKTYSSHHHNKNMNSQNLRIQKHNSLFEKHGEPSGGIISLSKIVPILYFLPHVKFPCCTYPVLTHVLPVVYTLVDSIHPWNQSVGGAILLYLLQESTPTTWFGSTAATNIDCILPSSTTSKVGSTPYTSFIDTTVHILSTRAIPSCRHVVSLSILCKAYSKIFDKASYHSASSSSLSHHHMNISNSSIMTLRRKATWDLLLLVFRLQYIPEDLDIHPTHDNHDDDTATSSISMTMDQSLSSFKNHMNLLCSILMGGIHPLLVQHAKVPTYDDTVELFRHGIQCLFPLLRFNSSAVSCRKVQLCTLSCLLTLYKSSKPIVHRHGGKLMSELLGCAGRIWKGIHSWDRMIRKDRQSETYKNQDEEWIMAEYTLEMTLHVCRITLLLCEERGGEILDLISQGLYDTKLIEWSKEIKASLGDVRKQYES